MPCPNICTPDCQRNPLVCPCVFPLRSPRCCTTSLQPTTLLASAGSHNGIYALARLHPAVVSLSLSLSLSLALSLSRSLALALSFSPVGSLVASHSGTFPPMRSRSASDARDDKTATGNRDSRSSNGNDGSRSEKASATAAGLRTPTSTPVEDFDFDVEQKRTGGSGNDDWYVCRSLHSHFRVVYTCYSCHSYLSVILSYGQFLYFQSGRNGPRIRSLELLRGLFRVG